MLPAVEFGVMLLDDDEASTMIFLVFLKSFEGWDSRDVIIGTKTLQEFFLIFCFLIQCLQRIHTVEKMI